MLRPRAVARRASAYALVLMTSMLVVVIGLAALTATRIQSRSAVDQEHSVRARQLARSAVELGMYMVHRNPNWRDDFGEGVWRDWEALGDSLIRVEGHDPIDGDPTNNHDDPIVIRGTARVGDATHSIEATMDATRGSELLEVAAHAALDVQVTGATLRADNWISTNVDAYGYSGADYYADVTAVGAPKGSTFHGTQLSDQSRRPDIPVDDMISVYEGMATTIDIASIPAGNRNRVTNPGFESGTASWSAVGTGTVITLDGTRRRSGSFSLRVTNRTSASDGVSQVVTSALQNQKPFAASAYVRRYGTIDVNARMELVITSRPTPTSADVVTTYTGSAGSAGGGFTLVSASFTPVWTGTLQSAKLRINSASSLESFYVDDVSLARSDLSSDPYLSATVLGPNNNPYGSGNANGVYLIDCGGQNLHIRNCRIHGTLILRSPGASSIIEQSVAWRPYVPNYPILVTNAGMLVAMTNTPLSESSINVNFNPSTAPADDEGLGSDTDMYDSYASQLRGLIVLGGDSELSGRNDIFGLLLCNGVLSITATRTDIAYDVRYLNNPPPVLDGIERSVEFRRGSFKPAAN